VKTTRKELLINFGLLFCTILLFFGGIEVVLRITGFVKVGSKPLGIYQMSDNPDISYELIPNLRKKAFRSTIKTNSLGLRSPEPDKSKPTIAVVGDSIVFGYGVENDETLSAQLSAIKSEYDFQNGGTPGYHLDQETANYIQKIKPLDPMAIILVLHFNDLILQGTSWLDEKGKLRWENWEPSDEPTCQPIDKGILGFIPGRCWLDEHSAFYTAIKRFGMMRQGKKDLEDQIEKFKKNEKSDNITEEQISDYTNQLEMLTTHLPDDMKRFFVIWPEKRMHTKSRKVVTELVSNMGFEVIDLYDTFGNAPKILGWDTVHPHRDTIKQAAEVIAKYLD